MRENLGWTAPAIRGKCLSHIGFGHLSGTSCLGRIAEAAARQGGLALSTLRYDPAHRPGPMGLGHSIDGAVRWPDRVEA